MTHCIHSMMRFMTVDRPVTQVVGRELICPHRAHWDVDADLWPLRRFRHPAAIRTGHFEIITVHVDRVVCHRQVANAHTHLVSLIHYQRINVGENSAVPCPQVEIRHRHDARHICSRINIKGVQHDQEITINWHERWVLGVNNEHTHHTHRHLGHFITMGVIHECT